MNLSLLFFFNDTATTEIYTLSLHDALPICPRGPTASRRGASAHTGARDRRRTGRVNTRSSRSARRRGSPPREDRKSTRLNSSHLVISYAVFCLKKKKKKHHPPTTTQTVYRRTTNT